MSHDLEDCLTEMDYKEALKCCLPNKRCFGYLLSCYLTNIIMIECSKT